MPALSKRIVGNLVNTLSHGASTRTVHREDDYKLVLEHTRASDATLVLFELLGSRYSDYYTVNIEENKIL
jgi:hypothetical protein